jgi:hypothetical protein
MYVIAKRKILFQEWSPGKQVGETWIPGKVLRAHHVPDSKDPQQIPDWVGALDSFKDAVEHGDMMEVIIPNPPKAKPAAGAGPGQSATSGTSKSTTPPVDLSKMNKDELQLHALEVHGLELDDKLKKEEMVAAIKEKAATA